MHVETLKLIMEQRLLDLLKKSPPENKSMFGLGMWMSKNLDMDDLESLEVIEAQIGEPQANQWLATVLEKSGVYVLVEEEGHVRPQ